MGKDLHLQELKNLGCSKKDVYDILEDAIKTLGAKNFSETFEIKKVKALCYHYGIDVVIKDGHITGFEVISK